MPWNSIDELPPPFSGLPEGAKELALAAGNAALADGATEEEAIEAMWAAVKDKYEKSGDDWVLRESAMDDTDKGRGAKGTFHSTWLESAGSIEYFEETVPEAEGPRRTLRVTLIEEGFSDNVHESRRGEQYRRYYPAYTIEQAARLAEGLPVYVGNASDHLGVKTLRDKAGVLRNVELAEAGGKKAIRGDLRVFKHQGWLLDMAKDDVGAFGPSIEAGGQVRCPATVDGRSAAIVESIDELRAALLVENPAAGGAVHDVYESRHGGNGKEDTTEPEIPAASDEATAETGAPVEDDIAAKDAKIEELTESIKEYESAMAEARSAELAEAAFPKAKFAGEKGVEVEVDVFAEATRNRLKEELKGETDETRIKEAIRAAVAEMGEILEAKGVRAGAPVNVGGGTPGGKAGGRTHLTEARKDIENAFGVKSSEKTEDGEGGKQEVKGGYQS